jgi:chromosome segregation and condensation protein ScpB
MESSQFFIYIGIAIASLFVYYLIVRWSHQIHKRNRYMKAQVELLAKIALKQGVNNDEIEAILNVSERPETL